jgi:hypothetical protein
MIAKNVSQPFGKYYFLINLSPMHSINQFKNCRWVWWLMSIISALGKLRQEIMSLKPAQSTY